MLLAGLFAAVLFIGILIGDRLYFRTLSAEASHYGCRVGRAEDRMVAASLIRVHTCFDSLGLLALRHGVARLFADTNRILLRPRYPTLWAFLWLWPMKATIDIRAEGDGVVMFSTKRIPWCSAILTGAWFLIVGLGTTAAVTSFVMEGGLTASEGVLIALGILILGFLFLFSGLVTVVMAYRLENSRLARLYDELRVVVLGAGPTA